MQFVAAQLVTRQGKFNVIRLASSLELKHQYSVKKLRGISFPN